MAFNVGELVHFKLDPPNEWCEVVSIPDTVYSWYLIKKISNGVLFTCFDTEIESILPHKPLPSLWSQSVAGLKIGDFARYRDKKVKILDIDPIFDKADIDLDGIRLYNVRMTDLTLWQEYTKFEPKCECGAKHTTFPDSHSTWCGAYKNLMKGEK